MSDEEWNGDLCEECGTEMKPSAGKEQQGVWEVNWLGQECPECGNEKRESAIKSKESCF